MNDTPNKPPGFFWTLTPDCQITKALDVASVLLVESRNSPRRIFPQVVEVGSQATRLVQRCWLGQAWITLPHLRDDNTKCLKPHVPCLTWPHIWNWETPGSLFFAFLESKPKRFGKLQVSRWSGGVQNKEGPKKPWQSICHLNKLKIAWTSSPISK